MDIKVPDIGDFNDVPVIEIHVKAGDRVEAEMPLVTLESDKATMDVPSSASGIVKEVKVKIGDKISEGSVVVVLDAAAPAAKADIAAPAASPAVSTPAPAPQSATAPATAPVTAPAPAAAAEAIRDMRPTEAEPTTAPTLMRLPTPAEMLAAVGRAHASPSVRAFARELGVDLAKVSGTGPKGRITQADVQSYVKGIVTGAAPRSAGGGLDLLPWPQVDFAKFGPIEVKPLSRIKKLSGPNLARNWVMIPAVTYHEDADITDLEALRVQLNKENEKSGVKLTMLAFIIKAAVAALQKYPDLNSSLDGENQVYKNYWHIGFAADTPNGLMVPVLKNADRKGIIEIAQETAELAKKAREGKIGPADMQGATFT
ncbi:MAG: 2-oxo acid dehydrogenase subunit E2, partial [Zoogloeaceae bacterium]|nr:2-oxo acid dehydrogenase subunit E2 [Zoogloeaceae bacterium]